MDVFELKVVDDEILKGNEWLVESPKAHIVIFEGMEEHLSRYNAFARFLNENGYSVHGLDTYGQGLNIKEDKSNVGTWPTNGFSKMVRSNDILVQKLKKEGAPVYIFAHSMGAFMGQDYIERFPGHVEKIILCGSGSKNNALGVGLALAKLVVNNKTSDKKAKLLNKLMFGNFNNKIKQPRTDFDWLSYNEENVNKYIDDPKCGFGPKNKFCYEFMKGMKPLYRKNRLAKINKNQQIHIISGSEDPVTNYGKSVSALKRMYNRLGINNVSTRVFKDMRHEILNEKENQIVFEEILKFLEK